VQGDDLDAEPVGEREAIERLRRFKGELGTDRLGDSFGVCFEAGS
jgi:hypothetical protein